MNDSSNVKESEGTSGVKGTNEVMISKRRSQMIQEEDEPNKPECQ